MSQILQESVLNTLYKGYSYKHRGEMVRAIFLEQHYVTEQYLTVKWVGIGMYWITTHIIYPLLDYIKLIILTST